MKFRVNRQEMADALSAVCNVTAIRTPKEVLKCVHLQAQSDVLLLSATDLELSIRCSVTQVEVDKNGEALVVGDTLNRIVHECNDDILDIEISKNELHVRGQGSHFQIRTMSVADFPPVPVMEGDPDFTIDHAQMKRLIEWTIFASARESTRYAINGVLWELEGERITMVATDGRRLSVAHGKTHSTSASQKHHVILPGKAMSLFARLPVDEDSVVGVKISSNQALIKTTSVTISTSLVEGHFPKYQDVIPKDCDRLVQLNTDEFHSALKRAALLTNEESKGVRLTFSEDTLTLSSRAPEQGEATISLPAKYKGETLEIGFNPVFLTDVLRVAHTEEITFAIKESNRPGVVKLSDDFIHVVMPVNLTSA